jgi:hypothetical protein
MQAASLPETLWCSSLVHNRSKKWRLHDMQAELSPIIAVTFELSRSG